MENPGNNPGNRSTKLTEAEKGKRPVNNDRNYTNRMKNRNVQNSSQSSNTKTSGWQKLRKPEFTSAIKELAKTAISVENPGNRSLNNQKTQIEKANNSNYVWNKEQKRLKRHIIGGENINFPNSPWPLVPIGKHLNKSQQMSVLLKMNEVANKFAKNDAYVLIENLKGLGPTLILKSLINNNTKVQANNKQSINSGTAPVRTPTMNKGTATVRTPTTNTGIATNKQSTTNSPFPELGNNNNVITTNGTVSKKIKNINSKECERLRMELKDKYIEYRRQCNKNLPQNFDTLFGK